MKKLNYAIIGNGNLGKACKEQILKRPDEFDLVGTFSRRESDETIPYQHLERYLGEIDVTLFCGGSSNDAPIMVPELNEMGLSTVDSYDNHGEIKNQNYQNAIKQATDKSETTAIIGAGWDPGFLSIQRILNKALIPDGAHNTFYGGERGGLSMGHTNALKRIDGVIDAFQVTRASTAAIHKALDGIVVPKEQRHERDCYIVAQPGKEEYIQEQILNMEGYFKGQIVKIRFITNDFEKVKASNLGQTPVVFRSVYWENDIAKVMEAIKENALGYPNGHSGQVIASDDNGKINLGLEMKSNPIFTANAMLAYGKANHTMQKRGLKGTFTIDEVPPAFLVDNDVRLGEI